MKTVWLQPWDADHGLARKLGIPFRVHHLATSHWTDEPHDESGREWPRASVIENRFRVQFAATAELVADPSMPIVADVEWSSLAGEKSLIQQQRLAQMIRQHRPDNPLVYYGSSCRSPFYEVVLTRGSVPEVYRRQHQPGWLRWQVELRELLDTRSDLVLPGVGIGRGVESFASCWDWISYSAYLYHVLTPPGQPPRNDFTRANYSVWFAALASQYARLKSRTRQPRLMVWLWHRIEHDPGQPDMPPDDWRFILRTAIRNRHITDIAILDTGRPRPEWVMDVLAEELSR